MATPEPSGRDETEVIRHPFTGEPIGHAVRLPPPDDDEYAAVVDAIAEALFRQRATSWCEREGADAWEKATDLDDYEVRAYEVMLLVKDVRRHAAAVIEALGLREDPHTGGRPGVMYVTKDFPRPRCAACGSQDRTVVPQRFRSRGPFCNEEFHRA
jgi:hypothetical protein